MNEVCKVNVQLEHGFDSFLRVINTLRRRRITVLSADYEGSNVILSVPSEDGSWLRSHLGKIMEVRVTL